MGRSWKDVGPMAAGHPLLIGLYGPSGGGKTYSALRLATGIARVTGGPIYGLDTEAGRMKAEQKRFDFEHVPFEPPFPSSEYNAAIQHCVSAGARCIVVDSTSHEHEGVGGVLEQQDALVKSGTNSDTAWKLAKAGRKALIQSIIQLRIPLIFCFRAKQKQLIKPGKPRLDLGWMPIMGDQFIFEMTLNALLLPGADGVPTWKSSEIGEHDILKLPARWRGLFADPNQSFCEDHGESLARWASGGPYPFGELDEELFRAKTAEELDAISKRAGAARKAGTLNEREFVSLKDFFIYRKEELAKAKPSDPEAA